MPSLPTPIKAALGLAASAVDEVRHLPGKAIELPMTALSTALQVSLRAQQRYAELVARGEAVLHRTPVTDEPPAWARFEESTRAAFEDGPFDDAKAAALLLDALDAVENDKPSNVVPIEEKPASARRTAPRKAPAKTARKAPPKTVRAPRNATPSKFDAATFEDDDE